jgi:hypothetical protein
MNLRFVLWDTTRREAGSRGAVNDHMGPTVSEDIDK